MQIEPYQPRHLHVLALQPHQQHLGVTLREHGWAEQWRLSLATMGLSSRRRR